MALGNVAIYNRNLGQGEVAAVEKYFLFLGLATKGKGKVFALDTDSDFADLFGAGNLVTQLEAARSNAGQNWFACAAPLAAENEWEAALDAALGTVKIEAAVVCDPLKKNEDLQALQAKAQTLLGAGRNLFFVAGNEPLKKDENWSKYVARAKSLVDGLAADRVVPVSGLGGTELGALAGRLANSSASIADSPMRVKTGPVQGLKLGLQDKDGKNLDVGTLRQLDGMRYSVPQWYPEYAGVYWGDGNTLAAEGSDYSKIENLRVADKAARRVRNLAYSKIADRTLNSTPDSIASHKLIFARPLREMAKKVEFNGVTYPGEIHPLGKSSVEIVWVTKTRVKVYLKIRPYNSPKDIEINLFLDVSNRETI